MSKKSYFLTYGSKEMSVFDIASKFEESLLLEFVERESSFFGLYLTNESFNIDKLVIHNNWDDEKKEWIKLEYADYSTIVSLSFTNGKNKDKAAKFSHQKKWISKVFDKLILLKEDIEEILI